MVFWEGYRWLRALEFSFWKGRVVLVSGKWDGLWLRGGWAGGFRGIGVLRLRAWFFLKAHVEVVYNSFLGACQAVNQDVYELLLEVSCKCCVDGTESYRIGICIRNVLTNGMLFNS